LKLKLFILISLILFYNNLYSQNILLKVKYFLDSNFENKSNKKVIKKNIFIDNVGIPIPIGVGNLDLDETIRDMQLLEKLNVDYSLMIRPLYTNKNETFDSLINFIDPAISYNSLLLKHKSLQINLLPLNFKQKFNSKRPFGWNDGAFQNSSGYQNLLTTGIFAKWHFLKFQIMPELFYNENKQYNHNPYWGFNGVNKSYTKLYPGNSSFTIDIGKVSISYSSQNIWWGPGIQTSLLMSNNAPGFKNYSISTNQPFLGNFEFQLIGGLLTKNNGQGIESNYLKKLDSINSYFSYLNQNTLNDRYFNGITISYQPIFFKNLFLGVTRSFQNYSRENDNIENFMNKYIPVFAGFFKNSYEDIINRDQYLSFSTRLLFPNDNAEIYLETGFNDAFQNLNDFIMDFSHASAYVFGIRKIYPYDHNKYLSINFEATRLAQTLSYLHRYSGNWYQHAQIIEGYTNENQIIGSGTGLGNNMQNLVFSYNIGISKIGLILRHLDIDPTGIENSFNMNNGLRSTKWQDYVYGFFIKERVKKIYFGLNLEFVNSKNYLWELNNNVTNISANLNISYLW
jgi:hypothetical protein